MIGYEHRYEHVTDDFAEHIRFVVLPTNFPFRRMPWRRLKDVVCLDRLKGTLVGKRMASKRPKHQPLAAMIIWPRKVRRSKR